MKIAFFVSEFPSLSETFILNQIIGLQNEGHLVHVFSDCRPSNKMVRHKVLNSALHIHIFYSDVIPNSRYRKIAKLFVKSILNIFNNNFLILLKSILKNDSSLSVYNFIMFIDKPGYDVVHAHFGVNGNYLTQLRKLGLFRKANFITTFHGYDLDKIFSEKNFYADLFKDCKSFTVNSCYSKSRLVELDCDENKIIVLPAGLNTYYFKKSDVPEDSQIEFRLLFVGRLIRLKGPHIFVEICRKLFERKILNFKATIIGGGAMFDELSDLIEKYHLKEIVEQKGELRDEEVLHYMNISDVFILPGIKVNGLAESQGLVIQEAQAMQLPVIISDVGGMKEGLIDGVSGFVLSQNDIESFVNKIELLAQNFSLRKRMGEAGRKFVEEKYDVQLLNTRLINLYRSKVDSKMFT